MALRRDLLLFPEGKRKAVTFSYDDAVTQDIRFVGLLNRYGLKGTFNINSGLLGQESLHTQNGKTVSHNKIDPEEIPGVYAGHELAVHGRTHLDLSMVPQGTASYEIMADRQWIETIVRKPVTGMAYPFGTYTEATKKVLESCGIEYSRTTRATYGFGLPGEFLCWHPTCHHEDPRLFSLTDQFLEDMGEKEESRLFYIWGHSYEFDVTDTWERMEEFLKRIFGHGDVWYASNGEICSYVQAARGVKYSADGSYLYNPSATDVWLRIQGQRLCVPSGETVKVGVS
ncbi:MAG TPA: polysaccharide deacetylase family protein [Candidatus Choladousia intestinigallinarum]|nr:polysaccharide deacetylase family protein [Candidatus Choladousia intestinigallinarum]